MKADCHTNQFILSRYLVHLFLSYLLLAPFLTNADTIPTQIVFISPSQNIAQNTVSEQLTVQSQDGSGNESKLPATACVSLSTSLSVGEFSSSATNWNPVPVLTLSKNTANRNFYYKSGVAGTHTITARVSLKPETEERSCVNWPIAEWPTGWSASQTLLVKGGSSVRESTTVSSVSESNTPSSGQNPNSNSSVPTTSSSGNGASAGGGGDAPLPRISVTATVPTRGIAGAEVLFEAVVLGLKKEPISNARVLWSFGDGGSAEGYKVLHTYHYPASYAVLVEASSGEFGASARKEITVSVPQLSISNIKEGTDGFIELQNSGVDDVDLSHWFLQGNNALFSLPKGTIVPAGKRIPFPTVITKLSADSQTTKLLFPNGTVAVTFRLVSQQEKISPNLPVKTDVTPFPLPLSPVIQSVRAVPIEKEAQAEKKVVTNKETSASVTERLEQTTVTPEEKEVLAGVGAGDGASSISWVVALVALVTLSVFGYTVASRHSSSLTEQEKLRQEAEEFNIIE